MTIKIGNAIIDNHNRTGIVTGCGSPPDTGWLMAQDDFSMRKYIDMEVRVNTIWLSVQPLRGGCIGVAADMVKDLGVATQEQLQECFDSANGFGKDNIKLLPNFDGEA